MKAAGHQWMLEVEPVRLQNASGLDILSETDDDSANPKATFKGRECFGLYLHYNGGSSGLQTKFVLRVVNQLPNKFRESLEDAVTDFTFSTSHTVMGKSAFMSIKLLVDENNGFKKNDCVIIEADITTYTTGYAPGPSRSLNLIEK